MTSSGEKGLLRLGNLQRHRSFAPGPSRLPEGYGALSGELVTRCPYSAGHEITQAGSCSENPQQHRNSGFRMHA